MGAFLDKARELAGRGEVGPYKDSFELVFETIHQLQAVLSKAHLDLSNIESVFTDLEMGRVIKSVPGRDAAFIPMVADALRTLIAKTIERSMLFPVRNGGVQAPGHYAKFAQLVGDLNSCTRQDRSVSVITFNYDVGADVTLLRAGFGPNYPVEGHQTVGQVDLLKLHGSLN